MVERREEVLVRRKRRMRSIKVLRERRNKPNVMR